jgi:hypothetical protein
MLQLPSSREIPSSKLQWKLSPNFVACCLALGCSLDVGAWVLELLFRRSVCRLLRFRFNAHLDADFMLDRIFRPDYSFCHDPDRPQTNLADLDVWLHDYATTIS